MSENTPQCLIDLLFVWTNKQADDETTLNIWRKVFSEMKVGVDIFLTEEKGEQRLAFSANERDMRSAVQFYEEAVWAMDDPATFPKPLVNLKYLFEKYKNLA